jgi:glycosyltransferase involved in cell wall biosynthesis
MISPMKPFTINIPIYNEEEILIENTEKLLSYLKGLNTEYEIIIVSNGSTDRSPELGEDLQKKHKEVRFFSLPRKGVGRAFRQAVEKAKYPRIISLDIDLSIDLAFIKEANVLLDTYQIVIGSKIMGTQKRGLIRKIGSGIFIYCTKLFLGIPLHDFSIGAKAFSRDFVLNNLEYIDPHTSYVLNLAYAAKKEGKRMTEIPVKCMDFRKSRFNLLAEVFYRFGMLFKLAFASLQKKQQ